MPRSSPLWIGLLLISGCWSGSDREVVVYSAADQDFAEPLFAEFAARTEITPRGKFDVESTKTVGLVNAILAEQKRPRCDVFWNNEILHTIRLQQQGLLQPYASQAGLEYPAAYRSSDQTWFGFGARARVIVVNTEMLPESSEWPRTIEDLADPKWEGRAGLAKPLFGTTATHAAVLFHRWGAARAQEFFEQVRKQAKVLAGNRQVAIAVARGQLAWGVTDTDDAYQVQQQGFPVALVFPDQAGDGTLVIPNTVAIVKGAPHAAAAQEFVDYLLSAETEGRLAQGPSAQFPLHPRAQVGSPVGQLDELEVMSVDFEAAASAWEPAAEFLRQRF